MYSWEINEIMCNYNYNLPNDLYIQICNTSPQISFMEYDGYNNHFYLKTNDGYSFSFTVYCDKYN